MLPHLRTGRCSSPGSPTASTGKSFYQKHWDDPPALRRARSRSTPAQNEGDGDYLIFENLATLLWLGQMAGLELHAWYSRTEPGAGRAWAAAASFTGSEADARAARCSTTPISSSSTSTPTSTRARRRKGEEPELHRKAFKRTRALALRVREQLEQAGLADLGQDVRTHRAPPLSPDRPRPRLRRRAPAWPRPSRSTRCRDNPKEVTVEWAVEQRPGKIFFDYNQNIRGKSLAVPYSPRRHAAADRLHAAPLGGDRVGLSDRLHPPHRARPAGGARATPGRGSSTPSRTCTRRSARAGARGEDARSASLRYRPQPTWMPPMLATLADDPPPAGGWIYEPKLDGVRVLIFVEPGACAALLPQPQAARRRLPGAGRSTLARGPGRRGARRRGRGDRSRARASRASRCSSSGCSYATRSVRPRSRRGRDALSLRLLHYEGIDLTGLPLVDRKAVLRDVVWYDDPIRFTPFRTTGSARMYRDACSQRRRGDHREAGRVPVRRHPLGRVAQDQVRPPAGIRDRRLHRAPGLPRAPRRAAGGLLRRQGAALRREGRHRLRPRNAGDALRQLQPLHRRTSPFAPGPIPAGESSG